MARLKRRKQTKWTYDNIFCKDSLCGRGSVRQKVIDFNILPNYECAECGNKGVWNKKELKLTVDHKNGIFNDNRVNNLRWLCPNCHSQTETFGSKKRM